MILFPRVAVFAAVCAMGICAVSKAKDITVAADGGDFPTVQAAIDSVPDGATEPTRILIKPGTYEQKLTIARTKKFIQLIGQGAKPEETVLTFHLKAPDPKPEGGGTVGTSGSSSVTINGSDISAENITFANSAGDKVGQAVAVKTTGDRIRFINCRFLGFQDTLYPTSGRDYFKDCYITGNTDFIFGNAVAVFDHCTINSSDFGYATAANTAAAKPIGFVFLDCTLTASPNVKDGSVYLGRPWQWDRGPNAAVTYIRTKMGKHISPAGWNPWSKGNTDPAQHARYSEFGSTDLDGKPLDISQRVAWSKQLSEEEAAGFTIEKVLSGDDKWDATAAPAEATAATQPSEVPTTQPKDSFF